MTPNNTKLRLLLDKNLLDKGYTNIVEYCIRQLSVISSGELKSHLVKLPYLMHPLPKREREKKKR